MDKPTPAQITASRIKAGLTQQQCAGLLHTTDRAWRYYEQGTRAMPAALWELFLLKTGQMPLTIKPPPD